MNRPKKWTLREDITISPERYCMGWIHRFICESVLLNKEIKRFEVKRGLYKSTGLYGICLFDENAVFVEEEISDEQLYLSILHEIFHYYFRDYDDERVNDKGVRDPIEKRAENSAQATYKWYKNNKKRYNEFMELCDGMQRSFLTDDEFESII